MERILNAKNVKPMLLRELLYRKGYHAAFTEVRLYYGRADILAINKNRLAHEFEIKTEIGDLQSELRLIRLINEGGDGRYPSTKMQKHVAYLRGVHVSQYSLFKPTTEGLPTVQKENIPNRFSFAVTPHLVDRALKGLLGTPYGLISVSFSENSKVIKRSEYLHKEKVTEINVNNILRRGSLETMELLAKTTSTWQNSDE